jgi:hypothetical protein
MSDSVRQGQLDFKSEYDWIGSLELPGKARPQGT